MNYPLEAPLSLNLQRASILRPGENLSSLGASWRPDTGSDQLAARREKCGVALGRISKAQRRLAEIGRRHVVDQLDNALLPSMPDLKQIRIVFTKVRPQFRLK